MPIERTGQVLRAALVGTKGVAELHAMGYRACESVRLVAVVGRDRDRTDVFSKNHNVRALYSVEEALADPEIDLIDIAAPTIDHADLAIQAAQAGKHCLCEKPLALGEKEFARMAQAFETSGTVLGGIFQCRFADEVRQLQDMITSGQLGNILTASSATKWWRDNSYFDPFQRRTYATAGGGVLMVQAIHAIDLVFQLFWKPVHSEVSLRYGDGGLPSYVEVEHTATVTLEFSSGATADIFATIRAEEARAAGDHMSRMSREKHTITVTGYMSVITIV